MVSYISMKRTGKTLDALAKLTATLPFTSDILRGSLLQRRIRQMPLTLSCKALCRPPKQF